MPLLNQTIQAPPWGETIPEHIDFLCWHLENHPEILESFFQFADDHQRRRPGKRFGASDVFGAMRWFGDSEIHAHDDVFALNNNVVACFARLYLRERPGARDLIATRKSWLDLLNSAEQGLIDNALHRGRARLEVRPLFP